MVKVGARLMSAVDTTEVVVVRVLDPNGQLECGGAPMLPAGSDRPADGQPVAGLATGTQIGKRYQLAEAGLEVLCVRAGSGTLTVDGTPLTIRAPKQLPASD
jgi:hypothetical protein